MRASALGALRIAALAFPGAFECYPFGPNETVFKAANRKMFLLCSEDGAGVVHTSVKLTPADAEEALALPFVTVAAYVGRYGWVSTHITNEFELETTLQFIATSHDLVTRKVSRARAK